MIAFRFSRRCATSVAGFIFLASFSAYSNDTASFSARFMDEISGPFADGQTAPIDCSESYLSPKKNGLSMQAACVRTTFPEDRGSQIIRDRGLGTFNDKPYAFAWTQVLGENRGGDKVGDPRAASTRVSTHFARTFNNWTDKRTLSASFTRQFARRDATNAAGQSCVVLVGNRSKGASLVVVGCADEKQTKKELKQMLKTLR